MPRLFDRYLSSYALLLTRNELRPDNLQHQVTEADLASAGINMAADRLLLVYQLNSRVRAAEAAAAAPARSANAPSLGPKDVILMMNQGHAAGHVPPPSASAITVPRSTHFTGAVSYSPPCQASEGCRFLAGSSCFACHRRLCAEHQVSDAVTG